jgi:hypothetical protein
MFQISAQVAAEKIFKKFDLNLNPSVFLLGISRDEWDRSHLICIEPENGYTPEMFSKVREIAKNQEAEGEKLAARVPSPFLEKDDRKTESKILRDALIKVLQEMDRTRGVVSFCSLPVPIQDYMVFVIIQLPLKIYESYYALKGSNMRDSILSVSLLDAIAAEFLNNCAKALGEPEKPGIMLDIIDCDYEELIRSAGRRLMYTPVSCGQAVEEVRGLFETCNAISSLKYESNEGRGKIIIARQNHPDINMVLTLKIPVPINSYRAIRKLLELTSEDFSLVSDAEYIYGLGKIVDTYNLDDEDLFVVEFTKHYTWQLHHGDNLMMTVSYGEPAAPGGQMDHRKFRMDMKRIFSKIEEDSIDDLWRLAVEASKQKHGTMLVISSGAEEEAERLSKQSTSIIPMKMQPDILRMVSSIDGAVLVNQEAVCYAIGVILDGVATEKGDASRGARFNSAIRYLESTRYECMIIVVSEDGMINLIPNLRPQILRSEVEIRIALLKKISESNNIDVKQYDKTMKWLYENRFYLLHEMCETINSVRREIEKKKDMGYIGIVYEDFCPDAEMNESYFFRN